MAIADEPIPAQQSSSEFRLVGKRTRRADAPARLTGQERYTADLSLPNLLHARLVRSPYASARIVSVEKEEAESLPGVVRVLTAEDLPVANLRGAVESRSILMAHERVMHVGQPVAIVIAETEAAAEDGVLAVQVEYDPQTPVVDPQEARQPDSPVVREKGKVDEAELAMHGAAARGAENEAPTAPNITQRNRYHRGDVEQGFAESDVVIEREFRTNWVHQSYMEPQVCAATVDPLGRVVVYASTQAMFRTRDEVARTLGLHINQVKVVPMPVGGGFGGKFGLIEPMVAACAKATGRSVRLVYTRMDEFGASSPAPASIFRVKAGARKDGTFVAIQGDVLFDAGAKSGAPAGHSALCLAVFYRWQSLDIEATEVVTHKTPTGAYRAPGLPQAMFAAESLVDDLARALNMDPLEIRKKNAARPGDIRPDNTPWPQIGLAECLERVEPIYRAELAAKGPNEGVGLALGGWFGGLEPGAALCRLESDGTLQVAIGTVDLTGTNQTFAIIAAEAFGLDSVDKVKVSTVDTDAAPYSGATGGSKATYSMGPVIIKAAQEARQQVLRIASAELEASIDDLELVNGEVRVKGVPGKVKKLTEIYRLGAGFGARYEPVEGHGRAAITERSPGTGVHVARVRVDPDTGRVDPIRYVVVQDVGKAINPAAVEAQIHGGGGQGVGWGLYEQIVFDEDGAPVTASLMDYTIPKASQTPQLQAVLVEVPSAIGPYGGKPVGEPPVIPGGAVIANAVLDATGVRVAEMPLTPERVLQAIEANH